MSTVFHSRLFLSGPYLCAIDVSANAIFPSKILESWNTSTPGFRRAGEGCDQIHRWIATSLDVFSAKQIVPGGVSYCFRTHSASTRLFFMLPVTCPTFQFTVNVSEVLWVSVADPDVTTAVTVRL
jgi:hypothetical protein